MYGQWMEETGPVKKMLESGETLSDEMIIQAIQSDSKN